MMYEPRIYTDGHGQTTRQIASLFSATAAARRLRRRLCFHWWCRFSFSAAASERAERSVARRGGVVRVDWTTTDREESSGRTCFRLGDHQRRAQRVCVAAEEQSGAVADLPARRL